MGTYNKEAPVAVDSVHQPPEQIVHRIECMGVYWPSLRKDVYNYIRGC